MKQIKPRRGRKAKFFHRSIIRKAAIAQNLLSDLAIAEACEVNQSIVSRFFQRGSCSELTIAKIAIRLGLVEKPEKPGDPVDLGKLRDRTREMKQAEIWDRQPGLF